jgi:hypothetical protein
MIAFRAHRRPWRIQADIVLLLWIVCVVSCMNQTIRSGSCPTHKVEDTQLDAESARLAILRFLEGLPHDSPARNTLDAVKASQLRTLGPGRVAIGPWDCALTERRFTLALDRPPAFFLLEGKFVQDATGVWNVVVTRTAQN